jgi:hypothetical protein
MAILWVSALPAYLDATDGRTAAGDPVGSLGYTLVCFAVAGLLTAGAFTASGRVRSEATRREGVSPGA